MGTLKIAIIDESNGRKTLIRVPVGSYMVIANDPCQVVDQQRDIEGHPGHAFVHLEGYKPEPVLPEPRRWMLDETPCWCVATIPPHIGWIHSPKCLENRAKAIPPKAVRDDA